MSKFRDSRLYEALDYLDEAYVAEVVESLKVPPAPGTPMRKRSQLRYILALAASLLLLSAAIPVINYVLRNYTDIGGLFTDDTTEETNHELTEPETPPEETTLPAPDTTEDTTVFEHETTEEPWPSTTAEPEDTTSPEETTECTHNEFIATENMPTCTESATVYCSCLACGYDWIEIMPPLGHNYVNNICTRCGAEIEYDGSQGLEYKINDDGKGATLIGMGSCKDTDIVVASSYKGYPVTVIGEDALAGYDRVKSITIPDSVTAIDMRAFKDCTGLESITIPDTVYYISGLAFMNCTSLKSIKLPASLELVNPSVFANCTALEEIVIPDFVTEIYLMAFYECTNLKSVTLGRRVEKLWADVFRDCKNLTEISFAGTMARWNAIEKDDEWNFGSAIEVVHCSDGDVSLIEYDGSRGLEYKVNADGKTASLVGIGTCTDKEIIVASTYNGLPVTSVDYSFSKISNITSITLSDSVLTVGGIDNMPDLVKVYFSKSVEGINPESLIGCPKLVVIEVDKENQRYMSAGNCLIEKATKTIVHGCKGSVIPSDGSVTVIGEFSFHACDWLTELTIPEGIERINAYAFGGCDSLRRVSLPDSLTYLGFGAFFSCESLESISLGSSLETLAGSVFENCPKLKELAFPKTTKLLCALAFFECKSLKKVSYEGTMAEWKAIEKTEMWSDGAAFSTVHCTDGDLDLYEYDGSRGLLYVKYGSTAQLAGIGTCTDKDIVIASTYGGLPVVIIEDGVFKNNKNIRSVTIPDKVHYIGKDAFAFCTSLESVIMPDNLKILGTGAFNGCTALTSINIPAGITEIGSHTFSGCSSLKEITIPEGVTNIGAEAFYLCKILKKVTLPSTLEYIRDWAFANCESLESIVIPEGVKWICQNSFRDCKKLSSLTLGKGLEQIQESAFWNCSSIKSVRIPGSVSFFGNSAFTNCTALESVTVEKGIEYIPSVAFSGCRSLTEFIFIGSVAEWNALSKGVEWSQNCPLTEIVCSDGKAAVSLLGDLGAIEAARKHWGLDSTAIIIVRDDPSTDSSLYKIAHCEYAQSVGEFEIKREVYVDPATGKCSEVVYDYTDIPEMFLDIILNKEKFTYVDQQINASGEYQYTTEEALFKDFSYNGTYLMFGKQSLSYSLLDIDGDSVPEFIIPGESRLKYGILLRLYEGKIYGYRCMLEDLYTDATYRWHEQAGYYRGTSQVYFDGLFYKSRTLLEYDMTDPDNVKYYVEGKETSQEEYEKYKSTLVGEPVKFTHLDSYPVYVNPYPGG